MAQARCGLPFVAAHTKQLGLQLEGDVLAVVAGNSQARLAHAKDKLTVITIGTALCGNGGYPQRVVPVRVNPLEVIDRICLGEAVDVHRKGAFILVPGDNDGHWLFLGYVCGGERLPGCCGLSRLEAVELGVHGFEHLLLLLHHGFLLLQLCFEYLYSLSVRGSFSGKCDRRCYNRHWQKGFFYHFHCDPSVMMSGIWKAF